jgi:hypothetical protein
MWALDELGLKYERVPLNTQGDSRNPEYLKVNPNGQGLRQSHLTYYYPTRVDLLAAAGRAAIDAQLATADAVFDESSSEAAAAAIAKLAVRHETTRVMMALAQAADQEPQLRALFRELGDGIVARAGRFLSTLNPAATEKHARLLHALSVGLAVVDLATSPTDGTRVAAAVLEVALTAISKGTVP